MLLTAPVMATLGDIADHTTDLHLITVGISANNKRIEVHAMGQDNAHTLAARLWSYPDTIHESLVRPTDTHHYLDGSVGGTKVRILWIEHTPTEVTS